MTFDGDCECNANPIKQLLQQLQVWQSIGMRLLLESTDQVLADALSDEETPFTMGLGGISGGLEEDAAEEIDTTPSFLQKLPVVPQDWEPLSGKNHQRQWQLPADFGTGPCIGPPQKYTDDCCHSGKGDDCAGGVDPGIMLQDQWNLPLQFFQIFFMREVFQIIADNTNAYAASKNARQPQKTVSHVALDRIHQ